MSEIKEHYNSKNEWEVPEIDLNLRHYSGSVSDVFKKIKHDIVNFLMKPNISIKSRQIYSAIYNALDYYEILSPEFAFDTSFLSSSIQNFNDDFQYLSQKYNQENDFEKSVISMNARLKSPLSFIEKVKDKVNEYIDENRNFIYFNESLRDILGVRVIIDPPEIIKSLGLQAESDYIYKVFYDLMCHKGILDPSQNQSGINFKFLDVNTRYDTNKLEKIKDNKYAGKFITTSTIPSPEEQRDIDRYECIIIPESRPSYMEKIDSKVKDYHLHPKKSGYQSLHLCLIPDFSKYVTKPKLPKCIIPSACSDYTIEYQFRSSHEDDFSNLGPASHEKMKPFEKIYHRLAIPSFIDTDDSKSVKNPFPEAKSRKILRPRNFGENYQRFYGPSFEERFNISYNMFVYTFDKNTQNAILAGKKAVCFDPQTNTYSAIITDIPIGVDKSDQTSNEINLVDFIEKSHLSDSVISTSQESDSALNSKGSNLTLYKLLNASTELNYNHDEPCSPRLVKKVTNKKSTGPDFEDK